MDTTTQDQQEQNQFEGLIQGLIDNNYGCCNNYIDASTVFGLRQNIHSLSESGSMQAAGHGNNHDYKQDKLVRGDRIKWLEKEGGDQFETIFLKKMAKFIAHLNRTCYTSINSFESHYASYEQKSFYKRHLDQFKSDKGRKFSIILYLNEDWQREDGGLLSLYPKNQKQTDIAPLGGRMVFFRSDEMEHEVHPSFTRERMSIAGWFKS